MEETEQEHNVVAAGSQAAFGSCSKFENPGHAPSVWPKPKQ
jgi:hypothetical protein